MRAAKPQPHLDANRTLIPEAAQRPSFDGYPYLLTRLLPGLHHVIVLPGEISSLQLVELAEQQFEANKLDMCLVLSSERCVYYRPGADAKLSTTLPTGGAIVGGRLKLWRVVFPSPETLHRQLRLACRIAAARGKAADLVGDLTKGGREATAREIERLAGSQSDGAPRGLSRCTECREYRGECLDPGPQFAWMLTRVHCGCDNDNLCARCGRRLHSRKLNANYFDDAARQVWHVPGFFAMAHICPKGREEER